MKQSPVFLIGFCVMIFFLFGLWLSLKPDGESKVIKIYKSVPIHPKSVSDTGREHLNMSPVDPVPKTEHLVESEKDDAAATRSLTDNGFSLEEEVAFWEWFAAQEADFHGDEQVEVDKQEEMDLPEKIPYAELYKLVTDIYELEDVLKIYGIEFIRGRAICPFCFHHSFSTHVDGNDGTRSYWFCNNCSSGMSFKVIDFVARIEGLNRYKAAEFLIGQSGLSE